MKRNKLIALLLPITLLLTLGTQTIYGATNTVTRPARVNNTYEWESGIYGMAAEKNTYVSIKGVKNTETVYKETTSENVEIEPSVGYAYYVAKTSGLNDQDMQSVIYMSDRWGNTSNVKLKGSKQEVQGQGVIYQRATQYGNVYYGILQDAIKNNKKVLKIKDEDNVKVNVKVLVDQTTGTFTVGPYKLELNVKGNKYTTEAAKTLYNELIKSGNSGFNTKNAFAKYTGVSGINGTDATFVDANGNEIGFPDFIPGQEKDFYIRFRPNHGGAIGATGNPVVNVSYLTKFTAKKIIKGTPIAVKFGSTSTNSSKSASISDDNIKVTTLEKRKYGASQTIESNNGQSNIMNILESKYGISSSDVETSAMRRLGYDANNPDPNLYSKDSKDTGKSKEKKPSTLDEYVDAWMEEEWDAKVMPRSYNEYAEEKGYPKAEELGTTNDAITAYAKYYGAFGTNLFNNPNKKYSEFSGTSKSKYSSTEIDGYVDKWIEEEWHAKVMPRSYNEYAKEHGYPTAEEMGTTDEAITAYVKNYGLFGSNAFVNTEKSFTEFSGYSAKDPGNAQNGHNIAKIPFRPNRTFDIVDPKNWDEATRKKVLEAARYDPLTINEAEKLGLKEGEDYFIVDWSTGKLEGEPQLLNDPVAAAFITEKTKKYTKAQPI